MRDKKIRQALIKKKMKKLNNKYKHVRRIELALPIIILPIFFLLFAFLPIPWDNLSMVIIVFWLVLQSHFIKKHSEYYNKRAAILPDIPDPLSMRRFCIVGAVIIFATGTIFFLIELFYSQAELEMYYEANKEKFMIIGAIVIALVFFIIVYFMRPASSKSSKKKQ